MRYREKLLPPDEFIYTEICRYYLRSVLHSCESGHNRSFISERLQQCQHPLIAAPKMSPLLRIIIPELKFCDVQRQIFVTDLVETAHDTALDQRPEAFDRVRMNCANDMLAGRMVNRLMREAI